MQKRDVSVSVHIGAVFMVLLLSVVFWVCDVFEPPSSTGAAVKSPATTQVTILPPSLR